MEKTKKSFLVVAILLSAACISSQFIIGCSEKNDNSFSTKFDTNSGSEISTKFGEISDEPIPTRIGYEFTGWYDDSNFKGTRIEFPYVPESDGKLYASWKLIDAKAATIQVFKNKYADHSDFISAENMTYSNGKYIYERKYSTTTNNQFLYRFIYDSINDNFEINGSYVLTFGNSKNKYYTKISTNNSFSWGKFDSGFSFLNEVSYYKDQGTYNDLYLIQTNLYTIKTINHGKSSATIEFTPNTHNNYSKLSIYSIQTNQQDEESLLQRIYDESIQWANNFLYYENITI